MAKSFKTEKLTKLFLDECGEYIDSLNQDLIQLEGGDANDELLKRVARNLHTLKGSSAMLEFNDVSGIANDAEDVLDKLKKQLPNVDKGLVDQIFDKVDDITKIMRKIKDGTYGQDGAAAAPPAGEALAPLKPEPPPPEPPKTQAPAPPQSEAPPAPVEADLTTGRTNLFDIFGPGIRKVLDRCFTIFGDIESKYVLADENSDSPEFYRILHDSVSYLYNALVAMGEPRINEMLIRLNMLLARVNKGDIPPSVELSDHVFTGVAAVKALLENFTSENPETEEVDIKPVIQKIELHMAVLKDQRDYMTLENAREIFDRFDVDRSVTDSLTPYEKFTIAHAMLEGLNIFDLEMKYKESEKSDLVSLADFFKPITDSGRFVCCMVWQKSEGGARKECHFHLYFGTEQNFDDFIKRYGYLSKLDNLVTAQISLSGTTTKVMPAHDAEPTAAPSKELLKQSEIRDSQTLSPPPAAPRDEPRPAAPSAARGKPVPALKNDKEAATSTVRVDTYKLDVLVNLIAELVINHNKTEGEIKAFKSGLNRVGDIIDMLRIVKKSSDLTERNITIDDILEPFKTLTGIQDVPGVDQMQPVTMRDFRGLRAIHDNLVQLFDMELEKDQVISAALQEVSELKAKLDTFYNEFQNDGVNIGRVIDELQDETMKLRMLPISGVLSKFPRRVRDIAKQLGKKIDFIMEGEETELDKTLIEELEDPLLHIIRNAIDHGIETKEVRAAAGKPVIGIIKASAFHEGNSVVVEVEDDGYGIDPEKVKRKAVEKRLISQEEAEAMDDKTAINLIFAPGFSTKGTVTDLSGRGVGMDVVKNSISKLKGLVDVQSVPGSGTKFKLKLPLTLAIIQAMIVKSHGQKFVIPMDPIESTERLTGYDLSSVEGKDVFRYQEMVIPLVKLRDVFNISDDRDPQSSYPVVIVGLGDKKVGVIVDEVIEKQQIVIKSLGEFLGDVKHVSGATIFGDGTIALILDVSSVVNSISYIARKAERDNLRLEDAQEKMILLVDDSLSGRIAQREMLEHMGFAVAVASSGHQALTMLDERVYDMVVTDINMPRMDGYELTVRIRSNEKTRRMPVIMVTSDVKKADRNKAYESGVNDFLAKPFSEEELRVTIEKHLRVY